MLLKRMFRKSRRGEDGPEGAAAAAADRDVPPASDALRRAATSGPGGGGSGRPRASGLRPSDLGRLSLDGQVAAREVARAAAGAPIESDADADDGGPPPPPRRRRGGRVRRVDGADELDDADDAEGGGEEHGELNGGGRRGGEGDVHHKANGIVLRDDRGGLARADDDDGDEDDYDDEEEEDLLPEARLSLDAGPTPLTRAVQESERNQNRRLSLDGILPPAAVAPNERGSRGSAAPGRKASSRGSKASSRGSGAAAAVDGGGGSSHRLSLDRDRRPVGGSSRGRGAEAVMDVDVDALTLPVELGGCSRAGTEPVRGGRSVTEVRKENQVCFGERRGGGTRRCRQYACWVGWARGVAHGLFAARKEILRVGDGVVGGGGRGCAGVWCVGCRCGLSSCALSHLCAIGMRTDVGPLC